MEKIAFVFSGQGAQYSGMGKELSQASVAAREVFALADQLRPGTSQQCFAGAAEELTMTKNTQPCLYCVDLAAARALTEKGIKPAAIAGFSLGEVAALTYAGVFTDNDGFSFVIERANAMQRAAQAYPSGMVAVLKLEDRTVEEICRSFKHVYPVNYNCPGQLVVAGDKEELATFCRQAEDAGGRTKQLAVSGGFHSPFMHFAAEELKTRLEKMALAAPRLPVYANIDAKPYPSEIQKIQANIIGQVISAVRWRKTIEQMSADGITTFIEVGAGKTLTGLIRKINKEAKTLNVQDVESLNNTLAALSCS